jgi:hypothetical protein
MLRKHPMPGGATHWQGLILKIGYQHTDYEYEKRFAIPKSRNPKRCSRTACHSEALSSRSTMAFVFNHAFA